MSEIKRKRKSYSEISEEEKAYRKEWRKENIKNFVVTLNKKLLNEFEEACDVLGVSRYSVIKNVMEETIKKAKQLEEE